MSISCTDSNLHHRPQHQLLSMYDHWAFAAPRPNCMEVCRITKSIQQLLPQHTPTNNCVSLYIHSWKLTDFNVLEHIIHAYHLHKM